MFVTSTREVRSPGLDDFIAMILDHFFYCGYLLPREAIIPGQRNARLNPKFRFPIPAIYVDVHPSFLAGKEKKPIRPEPKDRWTHSPDYTA